MQLSALSSWIVDEDSVGYQSAGEALPYWLPVSPIVSLHESKQLTRFDRLQVLAISLFFDADRVHTETSIGHVFSF